MILIYKYNTIYKKATQYPGGFPSIRDEKMSLLGDRKCDRPGFFSFFGYFSFFSFQKVGYTRKSGHFLKIKKEGVFNEKIKIFRGIQKTSY